MALQPGHDCIEEAAEKASRALLEQMQFHSIASALKVTSRALRTGATLKTMSGCCPTQHLPGQHAERMQRRRLQVLRMSKQQLKVRRQEAGPRARE
jgi:hypothetical protein